MDIDHRTDRTMYRENWHRLTGGCKLLHAAALLPTSLSHFHTTSFSWIDRVLKN
jgi:hypothetical protein